MFTATDVQYLPGGFFRREPPPLHAVLPCALPNVELLVIDGYVGLDPSGKPGLGADAHKEFGVQVIGPTPPWSSRCPADTASPTPSAALTPSPATAEVQMDSNMKPQLLNDEQLARSAVAANCAMNRQRQLEGPNSYTRELAFNPLGWLRSRLADLGSSNRPVRWLDLCCGSGRALIQAAYQANRDGLADQIEIVGVDLVDYFDPTPVPEQPLRLICADVTAWTPDQSFDLITCVHGLHYVGDKLGVLTHMADWLADGGLMVADFDPASIRLPDSRSAGRALTTALREAGFTYTPRRHRITFDGGRRTSLPYTYLGADNQAGPNYTGQPAVHSYYRR